MKGKEVLTLLEHGVKVSINSDDPAYFGGYISNNYLALAQNFNLTPEQIVTLVKNGFETSWISPEQKALYLQQVDEYVAKFN